MEETFQALLHEWEGMRGNVIPLLQKTQEIFGYLPQDSMRRIAQVTGKTPSEIYGVATFYAQFRFTPMGKHVMKVCHGTACHVQGADSLDTVVEQKLGVLPGNTTKDMEFTVERVACLGCCSLAPVVMIDGEVYGRLTGDKLGKIIKGAAAATAACPGDRHMSARAEAAVGMSSCGIAAGARAVWDALEKDVKDGGLPFTVVSTGCIGACHAEPLVEIRQADGKTFLYGNVDAERAHAIAEKHLGGGDPITELLIPADYPYLAKQRRIVLANCGVIDPESMDQYIQRGGYTALKKVLADNNPEAVIAEMKASGLRGRGGAGFSTGMKWGFAREAKSATGKKFVICNADEGDPGAFMDRSVLEGDPHAVLEGMLICAFAIGAQEGYMYVRAEYPLAIKRLQIALRRMEEHRLLGDGILGTPFSFRLHIKEGAGAFVCGEETALMASIEGRRGMPRLRPPFPAVRGLWDSPTNINNVETYANVPAVLRMGGAEYARIGTEKSKGTKVFALAGKIARGGMIEVPMGMSLREIIFDIGGGIQGGGKLKAVQMGGPSGGCVPESLADVLIDYDSLTATGAIMGSGGMVVMDQSTCMVDVARYFLGFIQSESCGKCTFCRIGTKRMLEILTRITEGKGTEQDIPALEELAARVKVSSLCGLGQTAPNPVLTTLRYFRDEYDDHIRNGRCTARKCKALIRFSVKAEACTGCTLCAKVCPTHAATGERKKAHTIDPDTCVKCGLCKEACRFDAIEISTGREERTALRQEHTATRQERT